MFVRFQIDNLLELDDLRKIESGGGLYFGLAPPIKAGAARADVPRPFSCAAAPLYGMSVV